MLVLSRKVNETILIPDLGISLQVLRVAGGKVCLGFEAPPDVSIIRREIASSDQKSSLIQNQAKLPVAESRPPKSPVIFDSLANSE